MQHFYEYLFSPHVFWKLIWYCIVAVVGSVSLGYWYIYALYGKNITRVGSGNSGATNAYRIAGISGFIAVFALDVVRAYALLFLYMHYMQPQSSIEVFVCVIILLLSNTKLLIRYLFSGFYSGKGVSTSVGVLLFFHPELLLAAFVTWVAILVLSGHRVGIASAVAVASLPLWAHCLPSSNYTISEGAVVLGVSVIIMCIVLASHAENIRVFLSKKMGA